MKGTGDGPHTWFRTQESQPWEIYVRRPFSSPAEPQESPGEAAIHLILSLASPSMGALQQVLCVSEDVGPVTLRELTC